MAYYENPTMLFKHLMCWNAYASEHKKNLEAIIVDDGSPDNPAKINGNMGFPISLFRIKQDIPWNQNGARNLAMTHARGLCLLTDMDHLLPKHMVAPLLNTNWDPIKVYKPQRFLPEGTEYKRHPNTYVISQETYWKAGGYDESFSGYYGTDSTFRRALLETTTIEDTDAFGLTLYKREVIPDASTKPERYGRKGTKYHVSQNTDLVIRKKYGGKPIPPLNFDWERIQ